MHSRLISQIHCYQRGWMPFRVSSKLAVFLNKRNRATIGLFYQKFNEFPISTLRMSGLNSPLDWAGLWERSISFLPATAYLGGIEGSFSRPYSNGWFTEINASFLTQSRKLVQANLFLPVSTAAGRLIF